MKKFEAGKYINQGHYKSFQCSPINRKWQVDDIDIQSLLSKADRHIGRLDMYSEYVNIDLFLQMHISKEATQSSKIEGTQTNIEETFLAAEEIATEKKNDWLEVQNYIAAMRQAVAALQNLPFSSRLIKETHKTLLRGARGEHKLPGEYRRSQNWIGGATINDATFIPPVHTSIEDLISDLEKFANDEQNKLPELLQIALIHYQFETIHPFLDGNGRVGRLLITLYLVDKGILKRPILYLSDFFERNRMLYYDNLMRARMNNDLTQWFKFFLTGVIETAKSGVATFDAILQLQKDVELKLQTLGTRAADAKRVIEYLYTSPIVGAAKVATVIERTPATAYSLIAALQNLNILYEITGSKRNRLFIFQEYVAIFKS